MIMAEKKMLKLVIVLTVITSAVLVIPARSQELSVITSGAYKNFSVSEGESLNVICQGLGDDNQKVSFLKWLDKEGNVISEGVPGTLEGENNSLILTFSDPKIEESGNYTCTALFDGKSLEKTVLITFYMNSSKPDFQLPYENATPEEGLYHEMFCLADGEPPITYEWYDKFGTQISKSPNSSIYTMKTEEGCTLIIPEVTLNDGGLYACTAKNQHGLSTKLFQLTVLPLSGNDTSNDISRIRSFRAINITSTSVKFAFNFSGPVRYIKVLYSESRSATQCLKEWKYGESYEIKNLISGGLYSFKFRSVPSLDDTTWSAPYKVVLLPGVPEVIFRYVGSGTVTLSWFRAVDDIMRSTIDRYELAYSTVNMQNGNTWRPNSCNITIQIPECAGSTYTISGLSRNIFYQIQLRAHTVSGYGEPNKQKIFMPQ